MTDALPGTCCPAQPPLGTQRDQTEVQRLEQCSTWERVPLHGQHLKENVQHYFNRPTWTGGSTEMAKQPCCCP